MRISVNSLNKELFQRNNSQKQSPTDKMLNNLNKQKSRLQDEIKKLSDSKDDEMTKKSKKEKLESQITDIDKQIAALQMEKLKQSSDTPKEAPINLNVDNPQNGNNQAGGVPLAESMHFMTALNENSSLKTMKKVHADMLGKAHAAMAKVSPNGAGVAERNAILAPVREFEGKMNAVASKIQDELKKANKEIAQKQENKKEEQKAQEEKETENVKNNASIPANNNGSQDIRRLNGGMDSETPDNFYLKQSQNQEILQYKKFFPNAEQERKENLDFQI